MATHVWLCPQYHFHDRATPLGRRKRKLGPRPGISSFTAQQKQRQLQLDLYGITDLQKGHGSNSGQNSSGF